MTFVPTLSPVSRALSPVCADLIPFPKRIRDSDYLADVEVDSRENSELSRSRGTDVVAIQSNRRTGYQGVYRSQGRRIIGVESAVTTLIERIVKLERDNKRLKGTTGVEGPRVDRLQRGMSRMQRELRQIGHL
ncbi:hypothetical protein Tco_0484073 [Tanacetum coccineum]